MYSSCRVVALNAAICEKINLMMDKNYINKTLKLIVFEFRLYKCQVSSVSAKLKASWLETNWHGSSQPRKTLGDSNCPEHHWYHRQSISDIGEVRRLHRTRRTLKDDIHPATVCSPRCHWERYGRNCRNARLPNYRAARTASAYCDGSYIFAAHLQDHSSWAADHRAEHEMCCLR